MKLIAAADKNWAIGFQNRLLYSIPEDMKFLRRMTMGHPIIMGRKTLDSFPGGKALAGRKNIVLTKDPAFQRENVTVVHDPAELRTVLTKEECEEAFVIGGASVYRLLLPLCNMAYITKINGEAEADAYFPNLDAEEGWTLQAVSETFRHENISYTFTTYRNDLEEPSAGKR